MCAAQGNWGVDRSDDDTWDIVSSVGYTALLVAGWRALHAVSPQPLVRDDYAKHFITASQDPFLNGALADPGTSEGATTFPDCMAYRPGFSTSSSPPRPPRVSGKPSSSRPGWTRGPTGCRGQPAQRYSRSTGQTFSSSRRGSWPSMPPSPPHERSDVAADLRDDWSIPLRAAGFDVTVPSAWSVEGILPYLTGDAQDSLFARITELSAPGSRLAIGALGSRLDQDRLAALEESYPGLNLSGEVNFSTLTYDDATKAKPSQWLAQHGWTVESVRTNPQLQREYGRIPAQVHADLDEIMHSEYVTATR